MKITQDVRDYAAKLNEARRGAGRGDDRSTPQSRRPQRPAWPQMSAKFREMGGQVYVDAERVKKSNEALK